MENQAAIVRLDKLQDILVIHAQEMQKDLAVDSPWADREACGLTVRLV